MINGSVLAPFIHDSTWPDEVVTKFRAAVFYRYVHVPGRDCVSYLRELTLYLDRNRSGTLVDEWQYLKDACDKTIHLALSAVSDEEMSAYTTNLLIFANVLLIVDFGFASTVSVHLESGDAQKDEEYARKRSDAQSRFTEEYRRCVQRAGKRHRILETKRRKTARVYESQEFKCAFRYPEQPSFY